MKEEKTQMMIKALMQRFRQNESLIRFLPENDAKAIEQKPLLQEVNFPALIQSQSFLISIHYSWFYPLLKELPPENIPLFLSLFPPAQQRGLLRLFPAMTSLLPLSPFARIYLTNYLKKKIIPQTILPEELIPPTKMSVLLTLGQKKLLALVDFLGLYDLAIDLRQVVDQALLTKVQEALSPEEKVFVQDALARPMKWISPKLGLPGWTGEKKALSTLLHRRGLSRLAKAVAEEHESYLWHFVRRFDTSRGGLIMKELATKPDPLLISFFQGQVFDILKRFK